MGKRYAPLSKKTCNCFVKKTIAFNSCLMGAGIINENIGKRSGTNTFPGR
jgi:hypothetical protein